MVPKMSTVVKDIKAQPDGHPLVIKESTRLNHEARNNEPNIRT
jgi:hypothetical protein